MYNILIIEDDANQMKNLANTISSEFSDLRIYSMFFNAEDAI